MTSHSVEMVDATHYALGQVGLSVTSPALPAVTNTTAHATTLILGAVVVNPNVSLGDRILAAAYQYTVAPLEMDAILRLVMADEKIKRLLEMAPSDTRHYTEPLQEACQDVFQAMREH